MTGTRKRVGPSAVAMMLAMLASSAHSRDQLAAFVGVSTRLVGSWLSELHAMRLIYISDWTEDARGIKSIARYRMSLAKCADASRPGAKPAKVRVAEYRARKAVAA